MITLVGNALCDNISYCRDEIRCSQPEEENRFDCHTRIRFTGAYLTAGMNRRRFLAGAGLTGVSIFAGCGSLQNQSTRSPPLVENRPDATYLPTHREGMDMAGMAEAGDYMVGLTYSFPHRFWTVTGTNAEQVTIQDADSVHLMATVWDSERSLVLPVSAGLSISITQDGETVADKSPWPMISQNMGFHYGDNYQLNGDGTYEITVTVSGMNERRLGSFSDRFDQSGEMSVQFDFEQAVLDDLTFEQFPERQGDRAALDLMNMEMVPTSQLPPSESLPGQLIGTASGRDEVYVATWLSDAGFLAEDESYLAISVRTPYNRIPLPMMSLDGVVEANGETVYDDTLSAGIHPDVGYHYGATVPATTDSPSVTVDTVAPPQVSRHEGYETAFITTPTLSF